jgi:hypothetical protein
LRARWALPWGDYVTAHEFKNKTYRALLRPAVKSIGLNFFMNANIVDLALSGELKAMGAKDFQKVFNVS